MLIRYKRNLISLVEGGYALLGRHKSVNGWILCIVNGPYEIDRKLSAANANILVCLFQSYNLEQLCCMSGTECQCVICSGVQSTYIIVHPAGRYVDVIKYYKLSSNFYFNNVDR